MRKCFFRDSDSVIAYLELASADALKEVVENPDMMDLGDANITKRDDGNFTYFEGGDATNGYIWGYADYENNILFLFMTSDENVEETAKDLAALIGYKG